MKAMAKEVFGNDSLTNRTIAVQGLGNVGYYLCQHIVKEGGNLIVTDIFPGKIDQAVREFNARAVESEEIFSVDCDIFAPCALGAVINDVTLPQLKCSIIAGGANNVLQDEHHGEMLYEKGILYAPDFVINAGGLINVSDELYTYNLERVLKGVEKIYGNIEQVLSIAKEYKITPCRAANRLAEDRIAKLRHVNSIYLG